MSPDYHVHIYPVNMKCEIDITASTEKDALQKALKVANNGDLKFVINDEGLFQARVFKGSYCG